MYSDSDLRTMFWLGAIAGLLVFFAFVGLVAFIDSFFFPKRRK